MALRKKNGATTYFGDSETAEFYVNYIDGKFHDVDFDKAK